MKKHTVQPTHEFFVVVKNGTKAQYSAKHLGRVKGWISKKSDEDKEEFGYEILSKKELIERSNEIVEVSFVSPHEPNVVRTTELRRSELGGVCDPSTERYWTA